VNWKVADTVPIDELKRKVADTVPIDELKWTVADSVPLLLQGSSHSCDMQRSQIIVTII
jgi:hypothetical protein